MGSLSLNTWPTSILGKLTQNLIGKKQKTTHPNVCDMISVTIALNVNFKSLCSLMLEHANNANISCMSVTY